MITSNIKGTEQVRRALQKEFKKYQSSDSVLIGITDVKKHPNSDLSVVMVGAINEFGTETIPERSFLRTGVADAEKDIANMIKKNGIEDIDETLQLAGLMAQQSVQEKITEIRTPANTPGTVKAKGSSNPLIDTGILRSSITYVVTSEPVEEGL